MDSSITVKMTLNNHRSIAKIYTRELLQRSHYDHDQNFFVQIYGKKKVRLISPEFSDNCYPINKSLYDAFSMIDTENLDLTKYPLFKNVVIYESILEPSDMLYIPRGWWHEIRSMTPSISANFWWISWFDFFQECKDELYQKIGIAIKYDNSNSYIKHFFENLKTDLVNLYKMEMASGVRDE